jgi:molecular chaperone GrpE
VNGETAHEGEAASVESAGSETDALPSMGEEAESEDLVRLKSELVEAKAKLAETHDRMLRVAADADNQRKRWDRERQEIRQFSITEFARDLLPVIDAFDKAMDAVAKASFQPETEEGRTVLAIVEGIQLVSKTFHDSVKKHGIERLPGKGEAFNPMYHNAVARVVDATVEQDTVVDEFVTGYRIGERVLRTAMVRVAMRD